MPPWSRRKSSLVPGDKGGTIQDDGAAAAEVHGSKAGATNITTSEPSKQGLEQTPFILLVSRVDAKTVELRNASTNELVYRIHDTGRKTLSSKPNHELYRVSGGDLLVGQLRLGNVKDEVKLPLTEKKISGIEKVTSSSQGKLKWETTRIGKRLLRSDGPKRAQSDVDAAAAAVRDQGTLLPWVAEVECIHNEGDAKQHADSGPVCAVRLVDATPRGRIEIWDRYADVNQGGDWDLLDEYVAVAYANLERVRREVAVMPGATALLGYSLSAMNGPAVGAAV